MNTIVRLIAAFVLTLSEAQAQMPYAGLQMRPIKALSEQQVADLKAQIEQSMTDIEEGRSVTLEKMNADLDRIIARTSRKKP